MPLKSMRQQGAQTLEKVKVETLVQSLQERVVRMEVDLERHTIQLRTQQLDFENDMIIMRENW